MEWRWCSTAARVVCSLPCGTAQQCSPRRAGLPARCGSSLQRNDAGVWLCEYPGLSFQRSPVCACSLVSSLLLSGATMSQQPSLTQSAHSVRQVLTAYKVVKCDISATANTLKSQATQNPLSAHSCRNAQDVRPATVLTGRNSSELKVSLAARQCQRLRSTKVSLRSRSSACSRLVSTERPHRNLTVERIARSYRGRSRKRSAARYEQGHTAGSPPHSWQQDHWAWPRASAAQDGCPVGYSSPCCPQRRSRSRPMNHPITNAANRNAMITPMLAST